MKIPHGDVDGPSVKLVDWRGHSHVPSQPYAGHDPGDEDTADLLRREVRRRMYSTGSMRIREAPSGGYLDDRGPSLW